MLLVPLQLLVGGAQQELEKIRVCGPGAPRTVQLATRPHQPSLTRGHQLLAVLLTLLPCARAVRVRVHVCLYVCARRCAGPWAAG